MHTHTHTRAVRTEGAYGQALLAEKNGKQFVLKEVVLSGRSRADQEDAAKEVKILRMVKHFNIIM